jgi:hypothetical protein
MESLEQSIDIVYNGKDVKTILNSEMEDAEKLAILGVAADIQVVLQRLRPDIEKEGGKVTVDIQSPAIFQLATRRVSEKLALKVRKALRPV